MGIKMGMEGTNVRLKLSPNTDFKGRSVYEHIMLNFPASRAENNYKFDIWHFANAHHHT
jgi:hypothetical protein